MAGHVLELRGCTPEPLGNYLKALGVFRLIAEQADPSARAWWSDGILCLQTKWAEKQVTEFFVEGISAEKKPVYIPTPIFAPWGGRPGFYEDGNEKARKRLGRLRTLNPPRRFRLAQELVNKVDAVIKSRGWDKLKKEKRAALKTDLIAVMRNALGKRGIEWIDACLALEEDVRFGFLYGTGGNEGSADITNNFWELIEEAVGFETPLSRSPELLESALFGRPRAGGTARTAGQHFPLAAGSANCGQGFEGSASANPWDVILMMEGAILFAGATTKRLSQYGKGKAAFPFMIDYLAVDEASGSLKDEASQDGQVVRCRAEFWMPLWHSPASLPDVKALLAEGRLQRRSGEQTEHTLHAMEAVKTLGVSRGIDAFHRVGLFERRGKGYYLASSLGYYSTSRSSSLSALLTEVEHFRQQVFRKLREGPGIPVRVVRARHRFHAAAAVFLRSDAGTHIDLPNSQVGVLSGIAAIEHEVATLKDRARILSPCPGLSRSWLQIGQGDPGYNLARGIAGIVAWGESTSNGQPRPAVESLRANLLPVTRQGKYWNWDDKTRSAVWVRGAPVEVNFAAVMRRRLIDAQRGEGDGLPLWSPYGATFEDLLAFWHGNIDEERLTDLTHALSLIDHGTWNQESLEEPTPNLQTGSVWFDSNDQPKVRWEPVQWRGKTWLSKDELQAAFALPRIYHLLKLCFAGGRLPRRPVEGRMVEPTGEEPFPVCCLDVLSLVEAGRVPEAAQIAARRLRAKGYPTLLRDPDLQALELDRTQARRLAGMLLIPVWHPGVLAALAIKPASSTS
jgi:CRISPR-associated protein Csx17